jgi:hypothetical protein
MVLKAVVAGFLEGLRKSANNLAGWPISEPKFKTLYLPNMKQEK